MDKAYCIFGDSVTLAAYVRNSWVDLLRIYLEEKYQDSFVNVFNLGLGGNTTSEILERFEEESRARMPTSIIFAVGVNDSAYRKFVSRPIVEEKTFKSNLERLIVLAAKFSRDVTFVGPVLGDDSILKPSPGEEESDQWWYDKTRVETFDKILMEIARAKKCKFICLLDKLDSKDFPDGLHPNEQGHRKIFEIIKEWF